MQSTPAPAKTPRGRHPGQVAKAYSPDAPWDNVELAYRGAYSEAALSIVTNATRLLAERKGIEAADRPAQRERIRAAWKEAPLRRRPDLLPPVASRGVAWRAQWHRGMSSTNALRWLAIADPDALTRLVAEILTALETALETGNATVFREVAARLEAKGAAPGCVDPVAHALAFYVATAPIARRDVKRPHSLTELRRIVSTLCGATPSERALARTAKALGLRLNARGRPAKKTGTSG